MIGYHLPVTTPSTPPGSASTSASPSVSSPPTGSTSAAIPATGAFRRFGVGMGYPWKGLGFLGRHPQLIPLCIGPVIVAALGLAGLATLASRLATWVAQWVGHGWLAAVVYFLVMVFVVSALVYFGLVVVASIAASPFCSIIAERVEALATGTPLPPQPWGEILREALRGLGHALLRTLVFLAVTLPFSLIGLFISPLAPFLMVMQFFITAFFLGYDFLDYPLSRRNLDFSAKWAYVDRHRGVAMGFGAMTGLLLLVPVLNLFIPPVAAIGATLMFLDLGGMPLPASASSSGAAPSAPRP